MEYLIRKATPLDLNQLVELCQNHAAYEQANYQPEGKAALLEKALFSDSPVLHLFMIEYQSQVAGYFTFTFDFSTWDAQKFMYLDCLYLEPAFRGKKLGEKVFEMLNEIAKETKCVNIQWQTPLLNERAIKFYNRIGANGKEKMRFEISLS